MRSGKDQVVRVKVPRSLYMAIVKLQASKDLDWEDACVQASQIINEFEKAVEVRAQRLYNERFMEQLNKARRKIREEGFKEGYDTALKSVFYLDPKEASKYGLTYPSCIYCGKPLHSVIVDANSNLGKWVLDRIREGRWHHTKCERT